MKQFTPPSARPGPFGLLGRLVLVLGMLAGSTTGYAQVFAEHRISTDLNSPSAVYATDVDGDGHTDTLWALSTSGTIAWFESDGRSPPSFTEHIVSTQAGGAAAVHATDMDGDGDVDVLSASWHEAKVAWHESDGRRPPTFTERIISTSTPDPRSVYATDVDGDGDVDVLSASFEDDTIAWWENDGGLPPSFTERIISTEADGAVSVYATDLDGDEDTDVLSASFTDNKTAWYESDGGSPPEFTEHVISTAGGGAFSVYATDVDGDGDTDVLSVRWNPGRVAWYESDGGLPPTFTERIISTDLSLGHSVYAIDVDGDEDTDVLSTSAGDDTVAWYESDGGMPPSFTKRIVSSETDGADPLYATDLDADGDTDVLSASFFLH